MMRLVRRLGGSAAPVLGVSVFSSGSGFAVAVAVARTSSVDEVGRYGIAAAALLLVTALTRSAVTDPLVALRRDDARGRLLGRASFIGLLGGLVLAVCALALRSEYLLVGAVAVHGSSMRESVRAVLVARGRPAIALGTEGVWFVVAVLALTGTLLGWWGGFTAFAIWALGGAALGYLATAITRSDVVPCWRATPVPTGRSLAFAADTAVGSGVVQLVTWIGSAIGGLSIAAALRGAGTLAGPVTVALAAARSVLIPRSVRHLSSDRPISRLARDTVLLCAPAAPVLAVFALVPPAVGEPLLGATWTLVAPILPLTALELLFQLVASVPEAAHRALGRGRRILVLRCAAAVVRIPLIIVVAPHGVGAVVLSAVAVTAASAVLWWWSLLHAVRCPDPTSNR